MFNCKYSDSTMIYIHKLASIGGQLNENQPVPLDFSALEEYGQLGLELGCLLHVKNGFYAFESALHVFGLEPGSENTTLSSWNDEQLWRYEYEDMAKGLLFFAEDAFGHQFCIHKDTICTFEPETGDTKFFSNSVDEWARCILDDYSVLTGYPLMREWQIHNGPIPVGRRLIPKLYFVLGGQYSLDNMYSGDAVEGMRARGNLARQIRDVPDGAQVRLIVE